MTQKTTQNNVRQEREREATHTKDSRDETTVK